MDEDSLINLTSAGLARWLFIVSMVLILGGPPLFDGRNRTLPVTEPDGCKQEKSSSCFYGKKTGPPFHPIILQAANRYQVDPALIKAIIMAESGYNPRAISKMGAKGLMQLMPATAKALGVEDSFNPEHNINAGVGYFKKLLGQFDGDVKLALAAYNAGTRKVRQYQGVPPFKATHYYIKKVFEYYRFYKKQMAGEVV